MSYILQALKKSQQDRELGQIPTLTTAADGPKPIPPQRVNLWSLGAIVLALTAVLIALYGIFAERLRLGDDTTATRTQAVLIPPLEKTPARKPTEPRTQDSFFPRHSAASTPLAPGRGTETPGDTAGKSSGRESGGSLSAKSTPRIAKAEDLKGQGGSRIPSGGGMPKTAMEDTKPAPARVQHTEFRAGSPAPIDQRSRPDKSMGDRFTGAVDPVGRPGFSQFLRSEAERLRARLAKVDAASSRTPATPVKPLTTARSAPPSSPPTGARKSRATASAPPAGPTSDGQAPVTAAPRPRPPLAGQLPPEIRSALPSRQIIAHIYTKEPERRFIIVNSAKLREGEATMDGLLLQEVRPDGIVFQFRNHSFFQPR